MTNLSVLIRWIQMEIKLRAIAGDLKDMRYLKTALVNLIKYQSLKGKSHE